GTGVVEGISLPGQAGGKARGQGGAVEVEDAGRQAADHGQADDALAVLGQKAGDVGEGQRRELPAPAQGDFIAEDGSAVGHLGQADLHGGGGGGSLDPGGEGDVLLEDKGVGGVVFRDGGGDAGE